MNCDVVYFLSVQLGANLSRLTEDDFYCKLDAGLEVLHGTPATTSSLKLQYRIAVELADRGFKAFIEWKVGVSHIFLTQVTPELPTD